MSTAGYALFPTAIGVCGLAWNERGVTRCDKAAASQPPFGIVIDGHGGELPYYERLRARPSIARTIAEEFELYKAELARQKAAA